MSELLAAVGTISETTWRSMVDDVRASGGELDEWAEPHEPGVRLACAGGRVRVDERYATAVDGWLEAGGAGTEAERVTDAYHRDGARGLRALRGELAFVLWDRRERRLVAACDPVGTRPLAYARTPGGEAAIVTSRALAILRDARVERGWNEEYVADLLCHARVQPAGVTAFAAIRRVSPGFALTVDLGAAARVGTLREAEVDPLDLSPALSPAAATDAAAARGELLRHLDAAVQDRVRSAAPACVALSGGLDSSVVAAIAARALGPIDALSMNVAGDDAGGERACVAALIAAEPRLHLREVDVRGAAGIALGPALPDDPIALAPAIAAARLVMMRAARDLGFRAVLDGEGGDEIFDLAVRLLDLPRAGQWRALARVLRARARERGRLRATVWRQLVAPRLPRPLRALWLARERRRVDPVPPWMTPRFGERASTGAALARLNGAPITRFGDALRAILSSASTVGARQSIARAWRAHGIEELSPLLDRRVIELVARVPPHARLEPDATKGLLRRASRELLPAAVSDAPKDRASYALAQVAGLRARAAIDPWVALAADCAPLRGLIDPERLSEALRICREDAPDLRRAGYRTSLHHLREMLFALLGFVAWQARLREEYGLD